MARIILKCPYLKGGSKKTASHLGHLVKYIATREGVEKIKSGHEHWHSTKKQQKLISQILQEFPESKEQFEYEDYLVQPNRENASEFITIALEQNLDKIGGREKYLDYIANRPRVEKLDTHGLFTGGDAPLILAQVAEEVSAHTGNVWTPIVSLRREDAAQMGFDSAQSWKALLSSKAPELAENLKIHPDHLKWYAAFHNESHHPHIHMICYSTDPGEGYLTKQGIQKMKSSLAQEIFRQELIPLYEEKTRQREELKEQAVETMRELIRQMKNGILQSDRLEQLISYLADQLRDVSGKKQYGYLRPELKNVVDEIVDELARDSRVSEAYRFWWETRGRIEAVYTETPTDLFPLSRCADFKPIRNMVIQEAMHISDGTLTFEEPVSVDTILPAPTSADEPEPDLSDDPEPENELDSESEPKPELDDDGQGDVLPEGEVLDPMGDFRKQASRHEPSDSWWTDEYLLAKQYLFGDEEDEIPRDFKEARVLFLSEAERDNPLAMYDLGRMCADGLGCEANAEESWKWYERALDGFYMAELEKPWKYTEYRIGKMYAAGLGTEQDYEKAADWLTLSANKKYKYAQYSLAGLYYHGKGEEQDHENAFSLYLSAANQRFPYASFELGKMLRDGIGCRTNSARSEQRFQEAFDGFTSLESQSHDDMLQYRLGWMLLNGVGTEKNIPQANEYLEKSAGVGNLFAGYQLARLILSEDGASPDDVKKALNYLRQAAEAENPYAAYFLGKLYLRGDDILRDVEEALCWFRFAAEKGNQYAECALGILYLKGEDVPKDVAAALEYLKRAAGKGNQFAQYHLGKIYLTGEDIPKDMEEARRYLIAAAQQGNQYAQYLLGKLYLTGKDVPKDKEAAFRWFTLSATQGNLYAQFFLDHMDDFKEPSVLLAGTRLLHHLSRIFSDNAPLLKPPGLKIDRKRRLKLNEKKCGTGHARGDHESAMSL
ncbi:MobP3 family relaxase [Sinanaerobacter chloroacetimidivorans]|uniref:SEL1-like repeat protein n=1 Tax=Sinanaerobacter chloroacetimidivorans TaxID=2818044 RepID=A0A8J7W3V4_9FIRM|nr:MobP3 family relaxase [Sinanaerobacter chloroacetimidivorans]MBR0598445.1 SEL1-like repeat protein [Sinanaerobacter chloroacetimidivorans]